MTSASCGVAGVLTVEGRLEDVVVRCNGDSRRIATDFERALGEASEAWRFLPVEAGACAFLPFEYRFSEPFPERVSREELCYD